MSNTSIMTLMTSITCWICYRRMCMFHVWQKSNNYCKTFHWWILV